jgi:predicted hotdog family 3-hydroxylacyl-ACP dehydratase
VLADVVRVSDNAVAATRTKSARSARFVTMNGSLSPW